MPLQSNLATAWQFGSLATWGLTLINLATPVTYPHSVIGIKKSLIHYPANMRSWDNAGLLLGQLRRWWANSKPTLGQRLMFAGKSGNNYIKQ